jgi:DNA-binding NarL/FixJ family response regulator
VQEINKPPIRVLIAEDHPIAADGIVAILANVKDMLVIGRARDGAETIELVKQHRPDIVLLDLRMPVVDGVQVIRWIKGSGLSARTVILTAFHSQSDVREAIRAGANAYLLKDVTGGEILKTIRRVHAGKHRISGKKARELTPNANSAELKPAELEVLTLIVEGHDNRTIAAKLGLRLEAVKYRLKGIFSKLGVRKRGAAASRAIERGLVAVD